MTAVRVMNIFFRSIYLRREKRETKNRKNKVLSKNAVLTSLTE